MGELRLLVAVLYRLLLTKGQFTEGEINTLIASLDAAFRLVAAMKVRRSELSTDDFLARLDREIARIAQSCK